MSMIVVDREKCDRDGICVAACPAGILELDVEDRFPAATEDAEKLCIRCGHCVAICPEGALSLEAMPLEDFDPIDPRLSITARQAEQFLRSRRSIRVYRKETVGREKLEELIRVASHAPSGRNLQPVRWLVVQSPEEVSRMADRVIEWMGSELERGTPLSAALNMGRLVEARKAGRDPICRGAPHLIVAHAAEDDRSAPVVCATALAYLELAALPLGLETCWAGYFTAAANSRPDLFRALGLPSGHAVFGAAMAGYPKHSYRRLPPRNPPEIAWL